MWQAIFAQILDKIIGEQKEKEKEATGRSDEMLKSMLDDPYQGFGSKQASGLNNITQLGSPDQGGLNTMFAGQPQPSGAFAPSHQAKMTRTRESMLGDLYGSNVLNRW